MATTGTVTQKIPEGVKPVERLWNLFQLYSMACYLMLHFRQLSHFTNLAMSEEQTTRLFEMSLQEYQEEPKGISRARPTPAHPLVGRVNRGGSHPTGHGTMGHDSPNDSAVSDGVLHQHS